MNNPIFFFSDIDDTLIQTRRKTDFNKDVVVGAFKKNKEENSFFYKGTKLFIDKILDAGITLIPTTARSISSYNRTTFSEDRRIKYAILNFGATIIIDNKLDTKWNDYIESKLSQIDIDMIYQKIIDILDNSLTIKKIDRYYINIHNKIDLDNHNIKALLIKLLLDNIDYYLHHNDNSFAILPKFINKKYAVEYMIDRYNPIFTLGAGDNISDLDFMSITDFKIVPKKVSINMV